jgi:hypothetical protein
MIRGMEHTNNRTWWWHVRGVCLVPFWEYPDHGFLKTLIPSRKATRDHLKQDDPHAQD